MEGAKIHPNMQLSCMHSEFLAQSQFGYEKAPFGLSLWRK